MRELTLRADLSGSMIPREYGFGTGPHLLGIRATLFDRVPIVVGEIPLISAGDPL